MLAGIRNNLKKLSWVIVHFPSLCSLPGFSLPAGAQGWGAGMSLGAPGTELGRLRRGGIYPCHWGLAEKACSTKCSFFITKKSLSFYGRRDLWVPCERLHMSPDPAHESRANCSLSKSSENTPLACSPSEKPSYSAFCGLITVA